mmetsp:Transcript_9969/g.29413  ORF Transcript_9969/g.29413 Transcript_9969/m.29413 type:complete len:805 (-) Transcript_9969:954-3368(-)
MDGSSQGPLKDPGSQAPQAAAPPAYGSDVAASSAQPAPAYSTPYAQDQRGAQAVVTGVPTGRESPGPGGSGAPGPSSGAQPAEKKDPFAGLKAGAKTAQAKAAEAAQKAAQATAQASASAAQKVESWREEQARKEAQEAAAASAAAQGGGAALAASAPPPPGYSLQQAEHQPVPVPGAAAPALKQQPCEDRQPTQSQAAAYGDPPPQAPQQRSEYGQPGYGALAPQQQQAPQQQPEYGQPGYGAQQPEYGAPPPHAQAYPSQQPANAAPYAPQHPVEERQPAAKPSFMQRAQGVASAAATTATATAGRAASAATNASQGITSPGGPANPNAPPPAGAPKGPGEKIYRDVPWAIAWAVSVVGVICVLAAFGAQLAASSSDSDSAGGGNSTDPDTGSGGGGEGSGVIIGAMIGIAIACGVLGALFASFYMEQMFARPEQLVTWTLYGSLAAMFVVMIIAFASGGVVLGVIFLLLFLLNCWYVWAVRSRIPFAAAVLKVAITALKAFPEVKKLPYGGMVVGAGWTIFWMWTFAVSLMANANALVWIYLFLCFFWTIQVIKNVEHVTASGTVGTWYFHGDQARVGAVSGALRRAVTTSFGSVCLGSLFVAIIKTVRALVHMARQESEGGFLEQCCFTCVDCLLGCLDQAVQYFNHYAYTKVALYGQSFMTAAKEVWEMISSKGLDAIVNDGLIGNVLFFGCLIGGALAALVAAIIGSILGRELVTAIGLAGFLVGFMIVQQVTELVESATATIFVCYADDPQSLARTHPVEFGLITTAFTSHFPQVMGAAATSSIASRVPGLGAARRV